MAEEYWLVRARQSSEKQRQYFGDRAFRPYLLIRCDGKVPITPDKVGEIIQNSFSSNPVTGFAYRKRFELDRNGTFEFDYARAYLDSHTGRFMSEKPTKIQVL
jgi:hypothetical protein